MGKFKVGDQLVYMGHWYKVERITEHGELCLRAEAPRGGFPIHVKIHPNAVAGYSIKG